MTKKALIAMSGGIDSSICAYLMKEQGFDCIGATMKLFDKENIGIIESQSCTSEGDINDAKNVCNALSIPHLVLDFSDRFRECVIDNFINSYESGVTPNPCIECNRHLKFAKLFETADKENCDTIVTGHYVRVSYDEKSGRYILKKALDPTKDQSYVLYSLTQSQLSRVYFPLGEIDKKSVREKAVNLGFVNSSKKESQDICFVDGSYFDFIENTTNKSYSEGNFIDKDGNILGTHKGIIRYTIGQRKGLGLSFDKPMFVTKVTPEDNTVTIGPHEELFSDTLIAKNVNLISVDKINEPLRVNAKVRYRHTEAPATIAQMDDGSIFVKFDEPQRAITKGQAVVFYEGDVVVGGGTIS